MWKTRFDNRRSQEIPQPGGWGCAEPQPEKLPSMKTSWAEKVKGNPRQVAKVEVREEREEGSEGSCSVPSAYAQRDQTETECWCIPSSQGRHDSEAWGKPEKPQSAWREVLLEGPHGKLTWAEEVELTQEVWYEEDGSVLCVGPPSPSRSCFPCVLHAPCHEIPAATKEAKQGGNSGAQKSGTSACHTKDSHEFRQTSLRPPQQHQRDRHASHGAGEVGKVEEQADKGEREQWVTKGKQQRNVMDIETGNKVMESEHWNTAGKKREQRNKRKQTQFSEINIEHCNKGGKSHRIAPNTGRGNNRYEKKQENVKVVEQGNKKGGRKDRKER
ncbi:hypothetical protein E2C01_043862 [Portunus trituberculatus]|uniref:Uncharacterized protein n=1 Tax=Portunus trituberculatus TaxID=210409 RepID=A0A5B7FRE1_PORTR|nr:hypothetical protein [Portunus trituberculatus]